VIKTDDVEAVIFVGATKAEGEGMLSKKLEGGMIKEKKIN
jgi:hypothetical protein